MHPFRRTSQILRFVSKDPLAKNSPKGWKSTETQLLLCPASVRTARCASRSKSFSVPPAAPATTASSARSNVTHSTADWWPVKERMGLACRSRTGSALVLAAGDHHPGGLAPDLQAVHRGLVRGELLGRSREEKGREREGVSGWDGDGESRERGPDAGGTSARRVDRAETPRGHGGRAPEGGRRACGHPVSDDSDPRLEGNRDGKRRTAAREDRPGGDTRV